MSFMLSHMKELRPRHALHLVMILAAMAAVFWVCTFKIMDRDFWWHITAGKMLLSSGHMIALDPFAYTRVGLPYLATHEWLAQILLFLLFHTFGSTGVILFRGVIACSAMGAVLLLAEKKHWSYLLLAVWAVVMTKGSFLERPQLFTFVFFSLFLLTAFRYLDAEQLRHKIYIALLWIFMELLWVNMHGGAALVGCAIVSFVLLEEAWQWVRGYAPRSSCMLLVATLILMSITIILPPNGLSTLTYIWDLLHDQTIYFIAEWQPRAWALYIRELWIFIVLAVLALITGRKHVIFSVLLFCMGAYLSRQAFRHEVLFALVCLAIIFYQSSRSAFWHALFERLRRARGITTAATVILMLFMVHTAYVRSFNFERQDNLFGFGQFDLARGAYDFVEKYDVQGNMFNTYGIGGYLIYRGYPHRPVFVDGRNVDYGLDFLVHAYAAGADRNQWDALVNQYDITYAIVDYDAIKQKERLPYSIVLDTHPGWALVYMDDWTAVYVKRTEQNTELITRRAYTHITPSMVEFHGTFAHVNSGELPDVIRELQQMQSDNPAGMKATVALAHIALREGKVDDAQALAEKAHALRPHSLEPLALLAAVHLQHQEFTEAAHYYDIIVQTEHGQYPDLDYAFIADVYRYAHRPLSARWLELWHPSKKKEEEFLNANESHQEEKKESGSGGTMVNPAADALSFHEKGLQAAERDDLQKAEEFFLTALKINPSFAEAWNNLCALQITMKHLDDALSSCLRAVEQEPEYADAQYNLALVYFSLGRMHEAKEAALHARDAGRTKEAKLLLERIPSE